LGNNFGKQLRGTTLGSNFDQLSGTILQKSFEEQQLSNFGEEPLGLIL
jgi:hypothetical protein